MSEDRSLGTPVRRHMIFVPGFAGFDVLGQLEYYAGITKLYQRWHKQHVGSGRAPVVLHYFDNLPTAGVATRAERLRSYLGKRIARGEIQDGDKIALVGHSTGGLDIRRLLYTPDEGKQGRLFLDGGVKPEEADRPSVDDRGDTAVEVSGDQILEAIDRVVFLSVPQSGTNIADWTRSHRLLRTLVVQDMRLVVEGARAPRIGEALADVLGQFGHLVHDPDIVLAAQDAIRETSATKENPTLRANAQEAASKLRLWLQHAIDDFAAIDDLAALPAGDSRSPAHYTEQQRQDERKVWEKNQIETMSFATIGRRPYRFHDGDIEPFSLTNPRTWPNRDLVEGVPATMDVSYLCAYRACAGGPFQSQPGTNLEIAHLDTSLFSPRHLAPGGPGIRERIEVWDNDGIVNTASMLWPDGPKSLLVAGDHGDIIGHYRRRCSSPSTVVGGREYASYDLLRSGTDFTGRMFHRIWNTVFDFCG